MKKLLFGIFAHPDDEAFGPCGTLVKAVAEGTELHLFTLTYGEAGQNSDNIANLGETREQEWRAAGQKIGATSLHGLGKSDGHLDNISMQEISAEIEPIIRDIILSQQEPVEVQFITLDPNGLTGHIDHIVAARSASFVFYRLKAAGLPLTKLYYYCNSEASTPEHSVTWIYADKGHAENEISEIVDARAHRERILEIMRIHHTQRQDCEHVLTHFGETLGIDHFIVKE